MKSNIVLKEYNFVEIVLKNYGTFTFNNYFIILK